jgi:hypothetical protein
MANKDKEEELALEFYVDDTVDLLYANWWEAKVKFAKAVLAIEIILEHDDIQANLLESLHEIADNAEFEYHKAYSDWLDEVEKCRLKAATVVGTA